MRVDPQGALVLGFWLLCVVLIFCLTFTGPAQMLAPPTSAPAPFSGCYTQRGSDIDGQNAGDGGTGSGVGAAITDDGSFLVVGFSGDDSGGLFNNGQVRTFRWNGTDYEDLMVDLFGTTNSQEFGHTLSMTPNGTSLAVAGPTNSFNGVSSVYDWNGTAWVQRGQDIAFPLDDVGSTILSWTIQALSLLLHVPTGAPTLQNGTELRGFCAALH